MWELDRDQWPVFVYSRAEVTLRNTQVNPMSLCGANVEAGDYSCTVTILRNQPIASAHSSYFLTNSTY